MWSLTPRSSNKTNSPSGESSQLGKDSNRLVLCIRYLKDSARDVYSKRRIIAVLKVVEIVENACYKHLDWYYSTQGCLMFSTSSKKAGQFTDYGSKTLKICLLLSCQGKSD
ncbi:hypothetical protein Tco_0742489 [Tanacetum coccineum]